MTPRSLPRRRGQTLLRDRPPKQRPKSPQKQRWPQGSWRTHSACKRLASLQRRGRGQLHKPVVNHRFRSTLRCGAQLGIFACGPASPGGVAWDTFLFPGYWSPELRWDYFVCPGKLRHLCDILQSMCKPSSARGPQLPPVQTFTWQCLQTVTRVYETADGAFEAEIPPPLAMTELPPALAATLQHIVNKLDMVAQVVGMVEERLSLNEDKMSVMERQIASLMSRGQAAAAPAQAATVDTASAEGEAES